MLGTVGVSGPHNADEITAHHMASLMQKLEKPVLCVRADIPENDRRTRITECRVRDRPVLCQVDVFTGKHPVTLGLDFAFRRKGE